MLLPFERSISVTMTKAPYTVTANVIDLPSPPKKRKHKMDDKWSPKVMKFGFTPLPNLLLRAQAKLKIAPDEFNILVQLMLHWWDADDDPHLAKETIALRIGKSARQVQRYITRLEKKGLLTRKPRYLGKKAQTSNAYSLGGLVTKLKLLEPEFAKAAEQVRLKKKKLETA